MACTWTITTNTRILTITGEGSPVIVGGNTRCINLFGNNIQVIKLSGDADGYCSYLTEYIVSATSANCNGNEYDCINGSCVNSSVYGTPGNYSTLQECQSACGNGNTNNCDGECVSAAKMAALEQAANQLQARMACR
jgi:hypothetical protein